MGLHRLPIVIAVPENRHARRRAAAKEKQVGSLPPKRCATTLQLMIRDGRLQAIATMRSNDVILGLPYDVFLFSMLQELMAVELNLEVGAYHHFVGSLHIYDSNLEWSRKIVASRPSITQSMPRMLTSTGITEFLKGEQETRGRGSVEPRIALNDVYWSALLEMLRYCNARRLVNPSAQMEAINSHLYRELVKLHVD